MPAARRRGTPASKAASRAIQRPVSPNVPSPSSRPVASSAATIAGNAAGRKSSGSITSLARVLAAIAAKTVPTVAVPSVARTAIGSRPGSAMDTSNITANTGNTNTSTTSMNSVLETTLPKKTASRPTGASRSPSSPPDSISSAIDRVSPSSPPNEMATHSTPGATSAAVCGVISMAKLNTTTTSSENTSNETTMSLDLVSSTMSRQTIAATGLTKFLMLALPCAGSRRRGRRRPRRARPQIHGRRFCRGTG